MAKLKEIVQVVISRETRVPTVAGFGRGSIIDEFLEVKLTNPMLGGGRYQLYSSTDEMIADGWATTDAVLQAAFVYFGQSPNPGTFMVGRKDAGDASWTVALTAINDAFDDWYGFTIVSALRAEVIEVAAWAETQVKLFGYDSSEGTIIGGGVQAATAGTLKTVAIGLLAAFQAVSDGEFAFDVDGGATTDVLALDFSTIVTIDEVADVLNANGTFSALATAVYNSGDGTITITSATTGATSAISVLASVAGGLGTDISGATYLNGTAGTPTAGVDADPNLASELNALSYDHTIINYDANGQDKAAITVSEIQWLWMGMIGEAFPFDPGSQTWAYKTISGVAPSELSSSQENFALGFKANIYTTVAGVNVVQQGTVIGGEYIDIIRGTDWLTSELQTGVFTGLLQNRKIPFTDPGISVVDNIVRGKLRTAADKGVLDPTSIVVTVPTLAETDVADRATRTLKTIEFVARYQGAIQKVEIAGSISV